MTPCRARPDPDPARHRRDPHRLVRSRLRTRADAHRRDRTRRVGVHHLACLLGYGATRLPVPRAQTLAGWSMPQGRRRPPDPQTSSACGTPGRLLKIASKMGISTARYEAPRSSKRSGSPRGRSTSCLPVRRVLGGITLTEIEREMREVVLRGLADRGQAPDPGFVRVAQGRRATRDERSVVDALHDRRAQPCASRSPATVSTRRSDGTSRGSRPVTGPPTEPRDLARARAGGPARRAREVEPAGDPARFSWRHVARGTFRRGARDARDRAQPDRRGRTPARVARIRSASTTPRAQQDQADRVRPFWRHARVRCIAEELQIKMAQGSKPGEGGQLPGHKVTG